MVSLLQPIVNRRHLSLLYLYGLLVVTLLVALSIPAASAAPAASTPCAAFASSSRPIPSSFRATPQAWNCPITVSGSAIPSTRTFSKTTMNLASSNSIIGDVSALSLTTASSTTTIAAALPTLDPTTVLSDILGGVLGTPLILAVPIVAALLVATLIAYLIVAYARPAEEE